MKWTYQRQMVLRLKKLAAYGLWNTRVIEMLYHRWKKLLMDCIYTIVRWSILFLLILLKKSFNFTLMIKGLYLINFTNVLMRKILLSHLHVKFLAILRDLRCAYCSIFTQLSLHSMLNYTMLVKTWMRANFLLLDHLPKLSLKSFSGVMNPIKKEKMLLNREKNKEKEVLMGASANAFCYSKVLH